MEARYDRIRRVIAIEGAANAAVLAAKLAVGWTTGSLVILGDAIHSLTDLANNGLAWLAIHQSSKPPDPEHPYGHRKFETLAVFTLATLLTFLGLQVALEALRRGETQIERHFWGLGLMLSVLAVNVALAAWESKRARDLGSDLLRADSRHTLADVLTTVVVIAGWQLSAAGYVWLDALAAVAVSALILGLAFGLFRRSIPILVDQRAMEPEVIEAVAQGIPGVCAVHHVRSRRDPVATRVDLVIAVDPDLATRRAHEIADRVERRIARVFAVPDVTVHVEPLEPQEAGDERDDLGTRLAIPRTDRKE